MTALYLLCHLQVLELQLGAKSMNLDLGNVSEWCDFWMMKFDASKAKTIIIFQSHTMHPQSLPLTIGRTGLNESDDLDILRVTFDLKVTFAK